MEKHLSEFCESCAPKLNKLIESWPVVYDGNSGLSLSPGGAWSVVKHDEKDHIAISSNFINSKRKARLAFIEEIKKEPCKHEPIIGALGIYETMQPVCKHCGVDLQAEWREVK